MPFTQADLDQFSGSVTYYRHWLGLTYTEGVKFLTDNGASWLVDAIASHQLNPKLRKGLLRDFQIWVLTVKDGKAVLVCKADSNTKPAITQHIPFTDFPMQSITLYVELGDGRNVIMLPSER